MPNRPRSGPPRWVGRLVGSILRFPAHRLLSGSLVLVTVRGLRIGRPIAIPVMYARTGNDLVVLVGDAERKLWWRSVRGGAAVGLVLGGRPMAAHADVVTGEHARSRAVQAYLERFRRARGRLGAAPVLLRLSTLSSGA